MINIEQNYLELFALICNTWHHLTVLKKDWY